MPGPKLLSKKGSISSLGYSLRVSYKSRQPEDSFW